MALYMMSCYLGLNSAKALPNRDGTNPVFHKWIKFFGDGKNKTSFIAKKLHFVTLHSITHLTVEVIFEFLLLL